MADDEWKKLPTEEKIEHKNWKARVAGYEELIKQFQLADDPKNPIYLNYLGLVKKFPIDTNEMAKEKALDAILAYIENIPAAAKTVGEVLPGIINKCLNGRPKARERSIDIIMMYIEIEKQELVLEELIKGLDNKQPKIVQACLEILRKAMNEFGSKIVLIKPIIKHIPKLLEDRDKIVRDEAKLMAVEMYRWAGGAIMPQFQGLKPIFMTELEEEFKKLTESGEKARQTRFLRSQQDLKAKMEAEQLNVVSGNGEGASAAVEAEVDEAVDPYDLLEPVDIIPRLPKDFKEKLEAKKWQERKEALEALQTLITQNPKLVNNSDFHELIGDLKKVVAKDANIVVATLGCKCIAGIAAGLRKEFSKFVMIVLEPLLERFKEKKQNVTDTVREALDNMYPSTNLDAINESFIPFLAHKTPCVRQQCSLFLVKCFAMATQTSLPKKTLKVYLTPLIKNISEADPGVRESAAEAIGTAYKALGEKAIIPLLGEIEQIKLDKIKEFADKAVLLNAKGEPRTGATAAAAVPVTAKPTTSTAAASKKPGPNIVKSESGTSVNGGGASSKPASAAAKSGSAPAKKVVKGGGGDKKGASASVEKEEPDLSPETVDDKAAELFTSDVCTKLANANWKERLEAIEAIMTSLKRMPSDEIPTQIVVRLINKKPGLKDSHFQVLKQKLEMVLFLASETKFSQRSVQYCVADIADKIGDVKNSQQAKDALSKIAESIGLQNLISQVIPPIFEAKNPKNQEHALLWVGQVIKEFGFTGVDLKSLIAQLKGDKGALTNSNAAVRSSAIQLIGTLFMYVGAQLRVLFENEKPALLEQIDNEIAKVKDQKPPAPVRFKKGSVKAGEDATNGGGDGDDEAGGEDGEAAEQQDLMPRVDISGQITEELITQLNDKNWKERQAALEKIETIIKEAKFIVASLGELPTHLNKRLTDSNKVLAGKSLVICEKLAESMGINGKKYCATLASGMIQALSDSKEALRKQALATLNAWFNNCGGLLPFLEGETLVESFGTTNPNLKAELCGWLASVLPKCKKLPPELKAIIGPVYTCLEDRSQEVRAAAQTLIEPLMAQVGPNEMMRVLQKAKPSSVTVIQPIVEKAKADLASKQPVAPPPQPKAAVTAPAKTTANSKTAPAKPAMSKQDLYDDADEAPVETKKAAATNGKDAKNAKPEPAKPTTKKKGEEEDLSPPIIISNKNKRIEEEKALKTLKWNFDVPRKEFVEQLKLQLEPCVNRTLLSQLFHDDFKYHIIALGTLIKAVEDAQEATISNIDLILRWLTLRFFETNPQVIVKAIDYMHALFSMLATRQHFLIDFEANAFIPYFITKLGDPKDPIRKGFKQIVKQLIQVYTPAKVFNFLIAGLTSKNARQRAECLEELGLMIEAIGLQPFNPQVTLKEMAKQIADRDNSVRSAALNAITIAYQISGEYVYKCIGKLNEKDQSMLDERIKRSAKSAGPKINGQTAASITQSQSQSSIAALTAAAAAASTALHDAHHHHEETKQSIPKGRSSIAPSASKDNLLGSAVKDTARISSTPKPALQRGQTQPIISKTKGEFQLDIKDDDDDGRDIAPIKLTPHKDLEELLSQPVSLPVRKNLSHYPPNILKDSQDCKEAIDLVITHISHQEIDTSFQYLLQIDVVIKDRDKKDLLQPHIDNLIKTCSVKLNVVHNVYMNSTDTKVEECFRLLKGLFMVILDVFEYDLGKFCNVKTLKELMNSLLGVMIDPKMNNLPDSDQLIKANNMVTLKVLELSEQTNSFCALISLLITSCENNSSDNVPNKFLELVMKCIWRQIRRLSSTESLINQLNTSKVLAEIHRFLKLFPTTKWTNKVSDLPLRTIKTLLYHLAKARQSSILYDLETLENPDESEIKAYVNKLFKNGFQLSHSNTPGGSGGGGNSSNTSISLMKGSLSNDNFQTSPEKIKQLNDQLSLIFKKISTTEQSKQGLEDLYDFKLNHPGTDLTKHLKKCSEAFQKYIDDGLKKVSEGRARKENLENHTGNRYTGSQTQPLNLVSTTTTSALTSNNHMNRNVDDIMKTIADWKSKTHLNGKDGSDDDFLRTKKEPDHTMKADQYLDIVKDLKKKYARSRTESDQLNDLKQLDKMALGVNNSPSAGGGGGSTLTSSNSNNNLSNGDAAARASNENLYDEYRRRLELIKKVKPIK